MMKSLFLIIICFQFSYGQIDNESGKRNNFPERTGLLNASIKKFGNNLSEYKTEKFILYCKEGSYADSNSQFLIKQADEAVYRIEKVLRINRLDEGFYIIIVDSRDEMKKFVGIRYKGMTSLENNILFMVFNNETRAYIRHELFHLVTFRLWGRPSNRILDEGGAMYADSVCLYYDNPIIVLNKYLYENKMWYPLPDLKDHFNKCAHENDMITYLQSALIFKYLYENFGLEKIKNLWQNGFDKFREIYGFDFIDLNDRLIKIIKNANSNNVDWNELMQRGCG